MIRDFSIKDCARVQSLSGLKDDIGDLKTRVKLLSQKIDHLSHDKLRIDIVTRAIVQDQKYDRAVHELKDVLRRHKVPRGKPAWK